MFQFLAALLLSFTLSDYNQIEVGQSSEFVHGLLGPAAGVNWEKGDEICLLWAEDDATITVTFKNDKVISKWQAGLD
jgi:hypothetical protein